MEQPTPHQRPKLKYKINYEKKRPRPGRKPLKGLALRRRRDITRTEKRLKISPKKINDAIIKQKGLLTHVAKMLSVPYATLRRYIDKHERCLEVLDEARNRQGDVAESKLFEKIDAGDVRCILYYLSTVHRNRGYGLSNADAPEHNTGFGPTFVETVNIIGVPPGVFLPKENAAKEPVVIDNAVADS